MKKIKIGILGCADIAERLLIPSILELPELFELVAVASRDFSKAQRFASKFNGGYVVGYENLLENTEIDAVYIPLPNGLHYEWIIKSLLNKKHVLSEKSLSTNFFLVNKILDEAQKNNLVVMENFMFRFHNQNKTALSLVRSGEIGDIKSFHARFTIHPLQKNNIRYNKKLGGGSFLDTGVYTLMAAQLFLGQSLQHLGSHLNYSNEYGVDISGGALLKNNSGAIAHLTFGFESIYHNYYEILGNNGRIYLDRAFSKPKEFNSKILLEKNGTVSEIYTGIDNHFKGSLEAFHNLILNEPTEKYETETLSHFKLVDSILCGR